MNSLKNNRRSIRDIWKRKKKKKYVSDLSRKKV